MILLIVDTQNLIMNHDLYEFEAFVYCITTLQLFDQPICLKHSRSKTLIMMPDFMLVSIFCTKLA